MSRTARLTGPSSAGAGASLPTPGKRAPTDGLVQRKADPDIKTIKTDVPLVDDKTACERDDRPGPDGEACWLDSQQRAYYVLAIHAAVESSMDNLRQAISKKRIELMTAPHEGWGFWHEVIFGALTYGLGKGLASAIGTAVKKLAPNIDAAIYEAAIKQVDGTIQNLSKGARKSTMNLFMHLPKGTAGKMALLDLLEAPLKGITQRVVTHDVAQLDDAGMMLLHDSWADESAHSMASYGGHIDGLLAQYMTIAEPIQPAGTLALDFQMDQHEQVPVRLRLRGRERVGVYRRVVPYNMFGGLGDMAINPAHPSQPEMEWVGWADGPIGALAVARYVEAPLVVDVERESGVLPPFVMLRWLTEINTDAAKGASEERADG